MRQRIEASQPAYVRDDTLAQTLSDMLDRLFTADEHPQALRENNALGLNSLFPLRLLNTLYRCRANESPNCPVAYFGAPPVARGPRRGNPSVAIKSNSSDEDGALVVLGRRESSGDSDDDSRGSSPDGQDAQDVPASPGDGQDGQDVQVDQVDQDGLTRSASPPLLGGDGSGRVESISLSPSARSFSPSVRRQSKRLRLQGSLTLIRAVEGRATRRSGRGSRGSRGSGDVMPTI